MQHERFNHHLFQALTQAGLEPLSFRERLDLSNLTREVTLSAILPGHEWPTRTLAEFGYVWTAADTAQSQGEIEPGLFASAVDLSCTLKYSPLEEHYTVQVSSLEQLRAFLRALVDKLPPALKDEMGGNSAEIHLLMGEGEETMLYGPVLYQLNQVIDLEDNDEDEESASLSEHDLEATLRDLAADALRGLMALDTLAPPEGLFTELPEEDMEEEEEDDEGEGEDEDEDDEEE